MSRSVAGFAILLICIVSGQKYPNIRLKGEANDPSISIDVISGGHYPAGSFNIGQGADGYNEDGKPGADININYDNVPKNPSQEQNPQKKAGQHAVVGFTNEEIAVGSNGQEGVSTYGVHIQTPGVKPVVYVPARSSANKLRASILNNVLRWFY